MATRRVSRIFNTIHASPQQVSNSRAWHWGTFGGFAAPCVFFLLCLVGCEARDPSLPDEAPQHEITVESSKPVASFPSSTASSADPPRIVAFGDSLTAGLGVSPDQSYPAQLQRLLDEAGYHYKVINAGVSGDTTAGGLRRVNWALKSRPSLVIVELGVNDALRGQPLAAIYSNLDEIITRLKERGAIVVLAGMKIPPNYGQDYTAGFSSLYTRLAKEHAITLIPFLLEGVAARPELNQADGVHPTADGYRIVADTVLAAIKPLLKKTDDT